MYSTVITKHATSVLHPVPKMGNTATQAAGALFSSNPEKDYPVQKIQPGGYSIPVKLEMSNKVVGSPNLKGYENPVIKGKSEINKLVKKNSNLSDDQIVMAQVNEDVNHITSKLTNVKSNKQKIKICKNFPNFSKKRKVRFGKRSKWNIEGYPKRGCELGRIKRNCSQF